MLNANQIKPNTPVVCSDNVQFAVVDHVEGEDTIKLNRDAKGVHHYIPMSWVTTIDDKVHVDRPGGQAMRDWKTSPPAAVSGKLIMPPATPGATPASARPPRATK